MCCNNPVNLLLSEKEQNAIQLYTERLKKLFGGRLSLVKIYGSVARGERWEESDIDIL